MDLFLSSDLARLEVDVFKVRGAKLLFAKWTRSMLVPPLIDAFLNQRQPVNHYSFIQNIDIPCSTYAHMW